MLAYLIPLRKDLIGRRRQERGGATVGIACKLSKVSNVAERDVVSARGTDGESGGTRGGARGGGGGRGDSQASGGSGRGGWKGSKGEEEGAGVDAGTDGEMDKDSQAATQVGRAAGVVVSVSEALRGWTGKTPKKMLEELLQKEKKAKPKFGVLSVNPARCDVTVRLPIYMRPHTTIYAYAYCYICVLILLYMCSPTTICVLILLYMRPHTTTCLSYLMPHTACGKSFVACTVR